MVDRCGGYFRELVNYFLLYFLSVMDGVVDDFYVSVGRYYDINVETKRGEKQAERAPKNKIRVIGIYWIFYLFF